MEGLTSSRRQPYAHWISWILAQLDQRRMMHILESLTTSFKDYSPTSPNDGCRGARGQRRAEQRLQERAQLEAADAEDPFAAADASLAAVEARLPQYLATDSENSEDDEDYTPTVPVRRAAHDDEAGPSGAVAPCHDLTPPTPPLVTVAQVTVPDMIAAFLQTLIDQQRISPSSRADRQKHKLRS